MIPIPIIGNLIDGITSIAKQAIPDPNLRAQLDEKLAELRASVQTAILQAQTYKWVDAIVKLMYALNDVGASLWRPLVTAYLFIWGLGHPDQLNAIHQQLGTVGDSGIAAIFGSFPAWMYSRHKLLATGQKS